MTTITVEIDKEKDIDSLKAYLTEAGYSFEVAEEQVEYTTEFKAMLDQRYEEIISGKVQMIDGAESERQVAELIARKRK